MAGRVVLSVVALGETFRGIRRPSPSRRRGPITRPIAELWGELTTKAQGRGRVLHPDDNLIAATALHHGVTPRTRNLRDFDGTDVRSFDPWRD